MNSVLVKEKEKKKYKVTLQPLTAPRYPLVYNNSARQYLILSPNMYSSQDTSSLPSPHFIYTTASLCAFVPQPSHHPPLILFPSVLPLTPPLPDSITTPSFSLVTVPLPPPGLSSPSLPYFLSPASLCTLPPPSTVPLLSPSSSSPYPFSPIPYTSTSYP